jgi:hypothetical protein
VNAEMITALVRATNDGVIPAPFPGEDTHDYRLRCAMAGAAVVLAHMREEVARRTAAQTPQGRPGDVTVTSPPSPDNPVPAPFIHREPVHSNGTSSADEIGVD